MIVNQLSTLFSLVDIIFFFWSKIFLLKDKLLCFTFGITFSSHCIPVTVCEMSAGLQITLSNTALEGPVPASSSCAPPLGRRSQT